MFEPTNSQRFWVFTPQKDGDSGPNLGAQPGTTSICSFDLKGPWFFCSRPERG
jgi:hypothetical protein